MIKKLSLIFLLVIQVFTSCKILYPSRMLKTPKDFKFSETPKVDSKESFTLSPNDIFTFKLFSNEGFNLIDMNINESSSKSGVAQALSYTISPDGTTKMPLLGNVKLAGLTLLQAEDTLEKLFSNYYIKPFVLLNVSSRRIIMFTNGEGGAKTIAIAGNSISLIEALAISGGLPRSGKAFSIKIFRGDSRNPIVYKVDLSTLEGYKAGNINLQSNDIVYVDAKPNIARNILTEIMPYFSLTTSIVLTLTYLSRLK